MHQTIYFGPKPLFLATAVTQELQPFADDPDTLVQKDGDQKAIRKAIDFVQQPHSKAAILLHNDVPALLNRMKQEFTVIAAAGGLVISDRGSVLLIFRRGKWDLPKGKLDEGENLEACAIREVEEETGLQNVRLEKPLCTTYHTYYQNDTFCLKESHWYLMHAAEEQVFTPQTNEDIEQCLWVKPDRLSAYLENTHQSILEVFQKATPFLKERQSK